LLPGSSGAPILDAQLGVAAVAMGGLASGGVEVSFAIPSTQIAALLKSSDSTASSSQVLGINHIHMSLEFKDYGSSVKCGTYTFNKIRELTYDEATQDYEDPIGLAAYQGRPDFGVDSAQRYSLYQNSETGAFFFIPDGYAIAQKDNSCVASIAHGELQLVVGELRTDGDAYALLGIDKSDRNWQSWGPYTFTRPLDSTSIYRVELVRFITNYSSASITQKYYITQSTHEHDVFLVGAHLQNLEQLDAATAACSQKETKVCTEVRSLLHSYAILRAAVFLSSLSPG
jgi:hypothetical protein